MVETLTQMAQLSSPRLEDSPHELMVAFNGGTRCTLARHAKAMWRIGIGIYLLEQATNFGVGELYVHPGFWNWESSPFAQYSSLVLGPTEFAVIFLPKGRLKITPKNAGDIVQTHFIATTRYSRILKVAMDMKALFRKQHGGLYFGCQDECVTEDMLRD